MLHMTSSLASVQCCQRPGLLVFPREDVSSRASSTQHPSPQDQEGLNLRRGFGGRASGKTQRSLHTKVVISSRIQKDFAGLTRPGGDLRPANTTTNQTFRQRGHEHVLEGSRGRMKDGCSRARLYHPSKTPTMSDPLPCPTLLSARPPNRTIGPWWETKRSRSVASGNTQPCRLYACIYTMG